MDGRRQLVRFSVTRRRALLALASSPFLTPPRALPQQLKPYRIGFLGLGPPSGWESQIAALRAGFRDLGHMEGRTIVLEFRWARKVDDFPRLAEELVNIPVDVIIAPASTQVEPARRATRTIPIVFAQHADPVGTGHVASLGRPGGNITGVSMVLTDVAAKGLEVLKEVLPHATRVGVLWNPTTPTHPYVLKVIAKTAKGLGVELVSAPIKEIADFATAFTAMLRERVGGFLVPTSPLTNSQPGPLAELALRHRLPGMFGNRANAVAGGLMSYGADFDDMYRRSATYVDKILRGAKPAELPVEQASKYQLIINRRAASIIGVTIPTSVLVRADEIVD